MQFLRELCKDEDKLLIEGEHMDAFFRQYNCSEKDAKSVFLFLLSESQGDTLLGRDPDCMKKFLDCGCVYLPFSGMRSVVSLKALLYEPNDHLKYDKYLEKLIQE